MRLSDLWPPRDWWFGRHVWYRTHVVAHFGHGALFYAVGWGLAWAFGIAVTWTGPAAFALFMVVYWEAWQREVWPNMPLYSNLWDTVLGMAGIAVAAGVGAWL